MTLLDRAREIGAAETNAGGAPNTVFLQATAASFKEVWRIVDAIMHAAESALGQNQISVPC